MRITYSNNLTHPSGSGSSATHSMKEGPAALPAILLCNHLFPHLQYKLQESEDFCLVQC